MPNGHDVLNLKILIFMNVNKNVNMDTNEKTKQKKKKQKFPLDIRSSLDFRPPTFHFYNFYKIYSFTVYLLNHS